MGVGDVDGGVEVVGVGSSDKAPAVVDVGDDCAAGRLKIRPSETKKSSIPSSAMPPIFVQTLSTRHILSRSWNYLDQNEESISISFFGRTARYLGLRVSGVTSPFEL